MTAGRIDPNTLERVVAIFYYGRSGSVFLQSLFDSHPDVLTVPAEHLHDFYPFWSNVASLPAAAQVTAFCDRYDALFEPGPAHWGVEREAFSAALEAHLRDQVPDLDHDPAPRKFFFQAVFAAYAEARGREFASQRPWIVFQAHNPLIFAVDGLLEDFGFELRFLHSLRDPLATMASWFRLAWEKNGPAPDLPGTALIRSIYHAKPIFSGAINLKSTSAPKLSPQDLERLAEWDASNSRASRLEDLHEAPRQTIEKICAWLDLPWHDTLLESTFDGRPWAQVSTDGSVLAGFRGIVAAAPDDLYHPLDRFRIKLLLADKYRAWKYPLPGWADNRLLKGLVFLLWPLPFRMERRIWRAGRPWTAAKVRASLREYLALRRDVMGWWWRDRQNGVPVIRLL
ncbi:MAG: sulfotransferase [Alphaproteobacteria bacterium]|nr:sulfotransferase [Alphaproteobacteria bacterium]HJP21616.1 sulfotransferase [Alphaproteobacteria bacterium]